MNAGKKKLPVNPFKQKASGKLKKENNNREDSTEIREVNDKLIGDDLEIKEAEKVPGDKGALIENKKINSNY